MRDLQNKKKWNKKDYQDNKKYYSKRQRLYRKELREVIQKIKSVPCADCHRWYPSFVMDFDHVRGKKEFTISDEISQHKPSMERLLAEIAKCDIVCSNCHRIRTHG
jgi:ABC-type Zn2+ transport system substrate-binding protein/surface adhesin